MESFAVIVSDYMPLTIVARRSVLDVFFGPGYAFVALFLEIIISGK